jgi:hypothetical protein
VDSNSDELNRLQIKPSKKETAKPAQHEVDPNEEARLLGLARRAIKSDPAQTLKRVARHRRLFGTGTFGEERDALEIEALHYTGQAARARERLESFVARYPASIHRPRLSARVP